MPLLNYLKVLLTSSTLLLLLCYNPIYSQIKGGGSGTSYSCTGCTTIITTPASTNFSVNAGQVVCIASGVTYTGNITLNGGTLCNQGTLTRVVFKSGKFNNLGNYITTGGLSIVANNDLQINCYNRSTFSVTGGVTVRSINIEDSIVIRLNENSLFTTNTAFTSRNTILKIYNGSKNEWPQSYFNVGTDLNIGDSTDFKLENWNDFNVGRNINLTNSGKKYLYNFFSYNLDAGSGTEYLNLFNVNGSINITGIANSGDNVFIDNINPSFNITKNLNSSIANAKVKINNKSFTNTIPYITSFYVGQSITLNNVSDTLINAGLLQANLITISKGTFINNADFYSYSDFKVINDAKALNNQIADRNFLQYVGYGLKGLGYVGRNLIVNSQGLFENHSDLKVSNQAKITTGTLTNDTTAFIGDLIIQTSSEVMNTGTLSAGNVQVSNSTFSNTKEVQTGSDIKALTNSTVTNSGTMLANGNIQVSNSATFANSNTASAGNDVLVQSDANATNNGTLTASRNVKITGATLINNNYVLATNKLDVSNGTAVYNNNGYTEIQDSLDNSGTINLADSSLIYTNNYSNLGANAFISGPTSVIDTASYAKLIISGASNNTGYINGRVIVFDQTLVGTTNNNGFGFDNITNSSRIANTVIFIEESVGPSNPVAINCNPLGGFYSVIPFSTPNSAICLGGSVLLSANLYLVTFIGLLGPYYSELTAPSVLYSWQPGNLSGQNVSVIVSGTQTYAVTSNYGGCIATNQISINASNLSANAGPDQFITSFPTTAIGIGASPTAIGGTAPYNYIWTTSPTGITLTNNTISNPQINSITSSFGSSIVYNVNVVVTDANGCTATDNLNVYDISLVSNSKHYAILNKKLDAGYYNSINNGTTNNFYFMFDEEYFSPSSTNLTYKIFNDDGLIQTSTPSLVEAIGDNRFALNVSSLTTGKYYKIHVYNQKNEVWEGRVKIN
ncbi:MAG: hypothetical protein SFY56_06835 [Bacteroidota bacterium]|nr:hypothetical protein [Bacteroidota bacterium]